MGCKVEITVLSGVSAGDVFRYNLEPDGRVRMGRLPDNELVLQDPSVSRNHAQIFLKSDGVYLADLGSSQGTVHMGFQLSAGAENGRRVSDGDEFKVGNAIFRINYNEDQFAVREEAAVAGAARKSGIFSKLRGRRLTKKQKLQIAVAGAGVVAILFLLPEEEVSDFPRQSTRPIPIASQIVKEEVVGYIKNPASEGGSDGSHADKATFILTGSDLILDYDYQSEAVVNVFLDEGKVVALEPTPSWEHKQLVIRDLLLGRERKLTFDNTDYPRPPNAAASRYKRWGVRNLRITPIKKDISMDVKDRLRAALSAAQGIESSPKALAMAIRSFQEALLAQITELKLDAVAVDIPLETTCPNSPELTELMQRVLNERSAGEVANDMLNRHLTVVAGLSGRLEAELWRRVNGRLKRAELAAAAENYIDAHDKLLESMAMFPDDTDYRFMLTQRMFLGGDVVPKAVRNAPGKYRKRKNYDD